MARAHQAGDEASDLFGARHPHGAGVYGEARHHRAVKVGLEQVGEAHPIVTLEGIEDVFDQLTPRRVAELRPTRVIVELGVIHTIPGVVVLAVGVEHAHTADREDARRVPHLKPQPRRDLRGLARRRAQRLLHLGDRQLNVVVAQSNRGLTALREELTDGLKHRPALGVLGDGLGGPHRPATLNAQRIVAEQKVDGVAVEHEVKVRARLPPDERGQGGAAGVDVVDAPVAEVNITHDQDSHRVSKAGFGEIIPANKAKGKTRGDGPAALCRADFLGYAASSSRERASCRARSSTSPSPS